MRLKELRKARKLKQRDVAEIINCSQAVYSRYETGEREPSNDTLRALADFFCVSVDYILGRDDEISAPDHTSIPLGIDLGNAYAGAVRYAGEHLPGQEPVVIDAGSSTVDLADEAIYNHYVQSHGPETAQTVVDMLNKLRRLTPEQVAQTNAFVSFLKQQAEQDDGAG